MPGSQYQIIAEVPVDDFAVLERVQKSLSRSFNLDLSSRRGQLRKGGVCVTHSDSLPDAEKQAELVRGLGADFRILDGHGRVVAQGEGRRGKGAAVGAETSPPTLLGHQPPPPGPPRPPRPTDPALASTLAPGWAPPASSAPAGPSDFNLDALDGDDLVLLDGSREEAPSSSVPVGLEQSSFAPPSEDEDLELDEPSPRVRPPAPRVPVSLPPAAALPEVEEEAPPLADLMPTATPERQPPAGPVPAAAGAVAPPARAAAGPAERSVRLSRGGVAARRAQQRERVLFGGWFRQRPRLRILTGFLLALGLGAVGPVCQSRSVVSSRIRPQLEDLSTARAHAPVLSRLPNFRTPEEIEETISSIKTRYSITSFLLWLALSGLLVFAWFRFV